MSFDSIEANRFFADKFGFTFPLLCDVDKAVAIAYGAAEGNETPYANRVSVLVDEEGKVEKIYSPVSPKTHPAQVLADVS